MRAELQQLYDHIEKMEVAMLTTRRADGPLESRAMAHQKTADGADLWFVTSQGAAKLRDIEHDPHVNLAYYNNSSKEWVSVSGVASISQNRQTIRELYATD